MNYDVFLAAGEILLVLVTVACWIGAYFVAKRKGRNATMWVILTIILGVLAFIVLYFLPSKDETTEEVSESI